MAYFHPVWVEHQRRHWMRPDAERYVRPDAHRFMPPGAPRWLGKDAVRYFWPDHKTQPARTRHDETEHARDVAFLRKLAARREDLLRLRRELAAINAELKFRRFFRSLKAGFNPNQPRLPRGNPGGGQWTSEGGSGGGADDPRILSDATPDDDWQPGAQYAQIRARGGPILINGQMVVPTPGQAARLAVVEARARDAISRVHEVDPNWRPRPSAYERGGLYPRPRGRHPRGASTVFRATTPRDWAGSLCWRVNSRTRTRARLHHPRASRSRSNGLPVRLPHMRNI